MVEEESEIQCPYCGETISVLVDCSQTRQSYIEDCSVCCRPIQIDAVCEDGVILGVSAGRSV
jgi:hypothetical protein